MDNDGTRWKWSFSNSTSKGGGAPYEELSDAKGLKKFMEEKLEDYNMEPGVQGMDLVMFGDAMDILFPNDGFDFLYINVMDHISDWPAFLEETKRVLKPHGIFFNDLDQNKMDDFAVHDNVKERKKLEQLVATKGFEEVSRKVINDEKDPGKYFYVNRSDKGP